MNGWCIAWSRNVLMGAEAMWPMRLVTGAVRLFSTRVYKKYWKPPYMCTTVGCDCVDSQPGSPAQCRASRRMALCAASQTTDQHEPTIDIIRDAQRRAR